MHNNIDEDLIIRGNILLLEELLTEAKTDRADLLKAIENREILYIYYAGDKTIRKGYRTVEPYLLGMSTAGNILLRAWQQAGASDSHVGDSRNPKRSYTPPPREKDILPGWRLFNIKYITTVLPTGKHFDPSVGKNPPFNPNDKQMKSIFYSVDALSLQNSKNIPSEVDLSAIRQELGTLGYTGIDKKTLDELLNNKEDMARFLRGIYQHITGKMKKKVSDYMLVVKNNIIGVDRIKNAAKYSENDIIGNVLDLYRKYTEETQKNTPKEVEISNQQLANKGAEINNEKPVKKPTDFFFKKKYEWINSGI